MKIDAHHHFWNPSRGDYGWMESEGAKPLRHPIGPVDFRQHLEDCAIDRTVLVQAAPTLYETEYLLGLADATPTVAKVVGWIDFENRDDFKHLERLKNHPKFSGVRPMIQDLADKNWMHRADVQWAYEALIDLDLTFDALGFPLHLENFLKLFERYPNMRTVIDHGMKPKIRENEFEIWAKAMKHIAENTSVHCKLSGLATEANPNWTVETLAPYVRHIIDSFGASRVMWGSDWPVLNLNGNYQIWHDTAQSLVRDDERDQIFGHTAEKFYRIT
jgi:L-fuconolactonase